MKKERKRREERKREKRGGGGSGLGLKFTQKKLLAEHSRKMGDARDLTKKSATKMAVIFRVR